MDFSNSLLQINKYIEDNAKWEVDSLDLKKYCSSKGKPKRVNEKNSEHLDKESTMTTDSNVKLNELPLFTENKNEKENNPQKKIVPEKTPVASVEKINNFKFKEKNKNKENELYFSQLKQKNTRENNKLIKNINEIKVDTKSHTNLNTNVNNTITTTSKPKEKVITGITEIKLISVNSTNTLPNDIKMELKKETISAKEKEIIDPSKKKIQNKDKNMLDHLIDLHKFRI